jgi:FkbM family methyltransferase
MNNEAARKHLSRSWSGEFSAPVGLDPATEEDVYYCYKLLLGRNPDANGFENFTSIIKDRPVSVDALVRMFVSSTEFKNRNFTDFGKEAVRLELPGFCMYASPDDWAVGEHILKTGIWEPHVTAVMKSVLLPGMVFVDIGANIGFFTLLARSIVGEEGRVYCFEPSPRNAALLHLSLEANSFRNVEIFPFALADSARLFVYDALGSNGQITAFDGNMKTLAARTVIRSVSMDQVVHLERCDVLKIDVEGAEGLAIRGAMRTIRACHPMIFSEFSPPGLGMVSRISGEDYLRMLYEEGYSVSIVTPSAQLADCGQDAARVMQYFERAAASHIDILATQPGHKQIAK